MKKDEHLVVYDNYLNRLSFKEFKEYDFNFFMTICERMRDLGEELQTFDYDFLMDLMQWDKSKSIDVFHNDLKRMCDRLRHVGDTIDIDPDNFAAFNLFIIFEGHKKTRTLDVQVNPKFKYILNKLSGNFTEFELAEYIRLDGKYAKLLYQHLKQYRRSGWWQISVDDIRRELAIPDSMPTMNIKPKVINPSIELIKKCKGFGELEVEVLRSPRRGRKVEGYKFKWTADKQIKGQMCFDDYKPKTKRKKKPDFEQNTYDFDELERQLRKN